MKSNPDAAARSAEIVTQLPVLSRLGMLRFERLNDTSWALLFLDPACERRFGIPASELCAPVAAPFASLMEPDACYRLHGQIQEQLRDNGHYLVRYTLHTPNGALPLLELGESYQQRQLLRGYLMVLDDAPDARDPAYQARLEAQNLRLQTSLELYQRAQDEHLQQLLRARAQQSLIVRLARHRYRSGDVRREAAELITQAACAAYDLARAGIWRLNGTRLEPVALYRRDIDAHEQPGALEVSGCRRFLEALQSVRAMDVEDALDDPRCAELAADYLLPAGITALLDASIRVGGEMIGVLSLEHTGGVRAWQTDEVAFAGELADQYAQLVIHQRRQHATDALHLFQRAVEQSASAFLLVDRDGLVEYVNPSFTTITQYTADEVIGRRLTELPALENLGELLLDAQSNLAAGNSWQGELRSRRKNLEPYWGSLSISKVYAAGGELSHYIGIYEDITPSKLAQQRIERLAYTDNLTGLGNRPHFIRGLEEQLAGNRASPLSLLLVDIDNFRRINDSLGHQTGDKLLVSLSRRLRNSLGGSGTLARFASNEFAVRLDHADLASGQRIAQELLVILEKPLFVDNQLINVTASLGLASAPEHGSDPQTLMRHAGLALHKAKANGKHQLQVFTEALNAEASYALFVESNLRRALTQNELEVFYQPKLCLKSGRLLGAEALLRWNHPQKGMIHPERFIRVAEDTGLIIPIGKWVVRQACRMSQELTALGLGPLKIAINLSPRQFSDPDLAGSIEAILAEEQLAPALLELELTESLLLEASEDTRRQLGRLKQLGLTLAMDDFGTGYSSLSYLKKFPIDVLKIDRSFVKDIPGSEEDMEIIAAVIAMAHKLRLTVVAEGIETPAQLAFLRRQRCDIGQGYLFDQPLPLRELIERIRRHPGRPTA